MLRVVFFKRKCDCLIECSICKQRRSETVACECDMQHAKLLSVKIDKSLSGGWEVPSGQVDCISAFLDLQRKISSDDGEHKTSRKQQHCVIVFLLV